MKIRITKVPLKKYQMLGEKKEETVYDEYGNIIPVEPAKFNVIDYSKLLHTAPATSNFSAATKPSPKDPAMQDLTSSFSGINSLPSLFNTPSQWTLTEKDGILDSSKGYISEDDTNAFAKYDWTKAKENPLFTSLQDSINTGSKKDIREDIKEINKAFPGMKLKKPGLFTMGATGRKVVGKLANTFNDIGTGIKVGTILGSAITDIAETRRKEKDFNTWMRSQMNSDALYRPVAGSRGDYVMTGSRFGEFRPDQYVVNKGMYTGQFYPMTAQYGGVIPEALSFPIDEIEANITTVPVVAPVESSGSSSSSSGTNPEALETWDDISTEFRGVENLGIWGDKKHRARKSDHNSGDALDIGITSPEQGTQIAQKLIKEAQDRNISYIIWNKQIWNPSVSNDWRPYSGENDHTSHVHVSFNRNPESLGQISLTHNNPLNIHQGDFAQKYNGKQGSKDGNGFVSMFPDLNTGIQAAKDLLFGPDYSSLTISEARNKWVKGDPTIASESSSHIVKAMGGNKKVSDLSTAEKEQLLKLFAKWEGKQAYNKIKNMKLFKEGGMFQYSNGGVYELTEDEIKSILVAGGEIEFI